MVIALTLNDWMAEDLKELIHLSVSSEIYEEKIGSREVILAIRTGTALEFDAVKQVLKKAGIDKFSVDDEAA
jgi:hypothetical protein